MGDDAHDVTTTAQLDGLYATPARRSLIKETDRITPEYRAWIEASPFVVVASAGHEGLDCSPRGDAAPVVVVLDEKTLLLPDRPGNNRIDTLRNLIEDSRIALLFLIPGRGETIRVNGRARISIAPDFLDRCAMEDRRPVSVVVVTVARVYFQCARAVIRADLWKAPRSANRPELPSCGEILAALDSEPFDGGSYDAELSARQLQTLY